MVEQRLVHEACEMFKEEKKELLWKEQNAAVKFALYC